MTSDDIDDVLKEKQIEILNSCNDELINQQMDKFADLKNHLKLNKILQIC